jgi:hypothetical protein
LYADGRTIIHLEDVTHRYQAEVASTRLVVMTTMGLLAASFWEGSLGVNALYQVHTWSFDECFVLALIINRNVIVMLM